MVANIIDGRKLAEKVREEVKKEVAQIVVKTGKPPKLAIIVVGDDPASKVYVRVKEKACGEVGIDFQLMHFPETIAEDKIIDAIKSIGQDRGVSGLLVQLPLPKGFNENKILVHVPPEKDVDGLHFINMGKFLVGEGNPFIPCTPQGIMELIRSTGQNIEGKQAVVVGRSNIVGKPVALLLLKENATVTICHSRTKNIGEIVKRADIIVLAVGKPKLITADMVKPGSIVIDVGVSRIDGKVVGDADFETCREIAGWITPVPGGVGPMTVAMLLKNMVKAAK